MKARRDGTCKFCAGPIRTGDALSPANLAAGPLPPPAAGSNSGQGRQFDGGKPNIWVHPECAAMAASDSHVSMEDYQPICKHWRRTGACLFESTCLFRHPKELTSSTDTSEVPAGAGSRSWQAIAAARGSVHLHVKKLPPDVDAPSVTQLFSAFGGWFPSFRFSGMRPGVLVLISFCTELLEPVAWVRQNKGKSTSWCVVKFQRLQVLDPSCAAARTQMPHLATAYKIRECPRGERLAGAPPREGGGGGGNGGGGKVPCGVGEGCFPLSELPALCDCTLLGVFWGFRASLFVFSLLVGSRTRRRQLMR